MLKGKLAPRVFAAAVGDTLSELLLAPGGGILQAQERLFHVGKSAN
jgi:hypothetical protein